MLCRIFRKRSYNATYLSIYQPIPSRNVTYTHISTHSVRYVDIIFTNQRRRRCCCDNNKPLRETNRSFFHRIERETPPLRSCAISPFHLHSSSAASHFLTTIVSAATLTLLLLCNTSGSERVFCFLQPSQL